MNISGNRMPANVGEFAEIVCAVLRRNIYKVRAAGEAGQPSVHAALANPPQAAAQVKRGTCSYAEITRRTRRQ